MEIAPAILHADEAKYSKMHAGVVAYEHGTTVRHAICAFGAAAGGPNETHLSRNTSPPVSSNILNFNFRQDPPGTRLSVALL